MKSVFDVDWMPFHLQWDERWGYYPYGNGVIGVLGCGPMSLSLVENLVVRHLKQGRTIICAMGPGEFTQRGHFIVLVGVEDGKIRINDCNSKRNSEKLWEFEEFKDQIRNMWAYSVQ